MCLALCGHFISAIMVLKKTQDARNTAQASRCDLLPGGASGRCEAPAEAPPALGLCQPIHHPVLHSGFRPPVPATLCLRAPGSGPCTCTEQQIALSCSLLFPRSAASIGLAWWGQLSDSRWQAQGSAKGGSAGALQQTQRSPP